MVFPTIKITMPSELEMTDEQFFEFCQLNRDFRIERTKEGELLIMTPTGSETGNRNLGLAAQLWIWTEQDGTGIAFDSSTGFTIAGMPMSPDASWLKLERWNALSKEQQLKFAPICPDFVAELRSPSDNLKPLKEKMEVYIQEGARLGWLIDRDKRKVYVYRPGYPEECLDNPATLNGDPVLPGFIINMNKIW